VPDSAGIVSAIAAEVQSALDWMMDGAVPAGCTGPVASEFPEVGAGETAVDRLERVAPNPFHPRVEVSFTLAAKANVRLEIYDTGGRRIRTLVSGELEPGPHRLTWDGLDDAGMRVASGIYWVRLETPRYRSSKKLVLLR
jgi:hypothetical protein